MSSQPEVTWDLIKTQDTDEDWQIWQDNGSGDRFSLDPFWRCRFDLFTAMCLLRAPRKKRGELRAVLEIRVAGAESLKWSTSGNPAICRRHPCPRWYMHVFILLLRFFFLALHLGILGMWCWLSNLCDPIWHAICYMLYTIYVVLVCSLIWKLSAWLLQFHGRFAQVHSNWRSDRIRFGLRTIWPWNLRTSGVFLIMDQGCWARKGSSA